MLISSPPPPERNQERPRSVFSVRGGSLVTKTKSASTLSQTQAKTYFEKQQELQEYRERSKSKFLLRQVSGDLLRNERVAVCGKRIVPNKKVQVRRDSGKVFYGNLVSCGSVWSCPCCAAKIARVRAQELRQGIGYWKLHGGYVQAAVLTFSHQSGESLESVLHSFAECLRAMSSGRRYQSFKSFYGVIGTIRNLEVTFGKNGWHVHSHMLLFSERKVESEPLYLLWESACQRKSRVSSFTPFKGGFIEADENTNVDYMCKIMGDKDEWTIAEEMSYSHVKESSKSYSPHDMLREVSETGDAFYADRFIEYAKSFKGRRQLYWSKGLKQFLLQQIDDTELSDEDIANEQVESEEVLGEIAKSDWRLVVKHGYRFKLLEAIYEFGFPVLYEVLLYLRTLERFDKSNRNYFPLV